MHVSRLTMIPKQWNVAARDGFTLYNKQGIEAPSWDDENA